jgi:hypothetical protein
MFGRRRVKQCLRCLRITDHKTVRRQVTFGEVERRMAAIPPKGYSFVSCNWKKRKARFVSPTGKLTVVSFLPAVLLVPRRNDVPLAD